ncbi:MAG: hypothetical protein ABIN79_03190 [Marmoricola sp.]
MTTYAEREEASGDDTSPTWSSQRDEQTSDEHARVRCAAQGRAGPRTSVHFEHR